MVWNEGIPTDSDISGWQPLSRRSAILSKAMRLTCQAAQSRIVLEADIERKFTVYGFDSGYGLEDFVRQALSELLPTRYSVDAGIVNDRNGQTAYDCDVLIRNSMWAPAIKVGATPSSRRYFHFAIESIYSVIELKQTIGFSELDKAMEKLVKVSRLTRPSVSYGQITENQNIESLDQEGKVLNPLYTAVVATRLDEGVTFRDLASRFHAINARLARDHIVSELLVLGQGSAWYDVRRPEGNYCDATFMWDRGKPLTCSTFDREPENVFYYFFGRLSRHLNRSILRLGEVPNEYGASLIEDVEHTCQADALYNQNL